MIYMAPSPQTSGMEVMDGGKHRCSVFSCSPGADIRILHWRGIRRCRRPPCRGVPVRSAPRIPGRRSGPGSDTLIKAPYYASVLQAERKRTLCSMPGKREKRRSKASRRGMSFEPAVGIHQHEYFFLSRGPALQVRPHGAGFTPAVRGG
jgi:hypothetical protein